MMWRLISYGTEPGKAHGLLAAWSGWEHLAHQLWPTTEIPGAPYHLLELRIGCYGGEGLTLPDGIEIHQGTLVGELHCNNQKILDLVATDHANPFAATREDLRSLAAWIQQDGTGRQIQALFGITMLTKGALRLGFMVRQQPVNIRRRFERIFMSGLLLLYASEGVRRLMTGTTAHAYPQEVWISRRKLIRHYGDRPARRPETFAGKRAECAASLM
ncbi:MAG TPA: hypothetical protein VMD75_12645 [Candidatus Binataceae bacterium]|nr:hypothetical protein [Candidatus Binataceae bacterium]